MALTSPACKSNFSQQRSSDVVILMKRAKFDDKGNLIPGKLSDMFLPTNYSKVTDSSGAKLESNALANSKDMRNDLINYDSELKFTAMHDQLGAFGLEISKFIRERNVSRGAIWEIWEIHSIGNPTMASDGVTITGDSLLYKRWVGPLTFNHDWAIGDDGKMIEREYSCKPTHCLEEAELKDGSITPLIAAYGIGKHWGDMGLWNNDSAAKLVSSK